MFTPRKGSPQGVVITQGNLMIHFHGVGAGRITDKL